MTDDMRVEVGMAGTTALTAALLRGMALPEPEEGSKDGRGCALVVAGSAEVPGAARLAAEGTLRAGAGKLQIATVASVASEIGITVPECMVIALAETAEGGIEPRAAAKRLLPKVERADAVLIGPGMAEGDDAVALAVALLAKPDGTAFVLDAAALCGLAEHAAAVRACGGRVVITPHAGEMAQLLDRSRDAVEADPLGAARAAAELLGAVVVMKGAESQIVAPNGRAWTYAGGGVGLATSGSGDVLAGFILGLLARGADPAQATLWGVFLHGESGSRLAKSRGRMGYLARELAAEVPTILHEMEGPG